MAIAYELLQNIQKRCVHVTRREINVYTWYETFAILYQSLYGDSITKIPYTVAMRSMIVSWCIYSFLITSAFTAKLISSLVRPKHLPDINTIEELGSSNYRIIYPDYLNGTLYTFLNSDRWSFVKLQDQMMVVTARDFYTLVNNNRTENAYVMTNYMAEYMVSKHFDSASGRSYYNLMRECLIYLPKVYLVQRGSSFLGHFNELLTRFNEMGFIVHWDRETEYEYSAEGIIQEAEEEEDPSEIKVVIKVTHLQSGFYLLVIGLLISFIALLAELWYYRRRQLQLSTVVYFDKDLARYYGCNVDT